MKYTPNITMYFLDKISSESLTKKRLAIQSCEKTISESIKKKQGTGNNKAQKNQNASSTTKDFEKYTVATIVSYYI